MDTGGPSPPAAFLEEHAASLVDLAAELVEVDTQNPPGETIGAVDRLEAYLDDLGLATETVTVDPRKPNLLATLPGGRDEVLCLGGHLDTVPFDASEWSRDPLGERDGHRLYGRGTTDMKGAVASMAAVARAFVETGTEPPVTLRFAFVPDEETGGDAGTRALVEGGHLEADACVIGEPTGTPSRPSVVVADRGAIWLTMVAEGEAAHGSRPMLGENAIDRLYGGIQTLRERFGSRPLEVDASVRPIVNESIEFYAPSLGEDVARALFEQPTINLGTFEGGDAINTVPASASAEIDIRLSPGVDTGTVLEAIRGCARDCEGVSLADISWSVGSNVAIDSPIVDAVSSVAGRVTGETLSRRSGTGGGDAKPMRRAGIPTVEFALDTDTAHATDEFTTTDLLVQNAQIYAALPAALADRRS